MATVAAVAPVVVPGAAAAAGPDWPVVVVSGADPEAAARAVTGAGGRVLSRLPIAGGVAAALPPGTRLGAGWVVAPQREIRVAATPPGSAGTPAATLRQTLGLAPDGNEGRGVTVAVVDTGIADVPDLRPAVVRRVDLAGDGPGDGYGHGTFMAGLIAGSGAASGGAYRGVAPAASLVDVKVADQLGRTDLVTVLRGLQWVDDHAKDVDVLNLSLSSDSPLPYQVDPLNQALRALWRKGVTVVVPSGNDGPGAGTVTSPGNDPTLLTAGGLDESGTAARADDVVGTWSGRGPTTQGVAKPDLVAPGGHVVSLRAPGSVIDAGSPQARVGDAYFRGSGTSMATAVTAGVAAATLARQGRLRPDAVKQLFVATAYPAAGLTRQAGGGAGGLDAATVLRLAPTWHAGNAGSGDPGDTAAVNRDAKVWAELERALLNGDAAGSARAWDRLSPASRDWAARAWADVDPAARAWAARAWAARAWAGADDTWTARAWAARAWAARAWAGSDWAARAWAARAWAGTDWAGVDWGGVDWGARAWASERWSARAWAWLPAA